MHIDNQEQQLFVLPCEAFSFLSEILFSFHSSRESWVREEIMAHGILYDRQGSWEKPEGETVSRPNLAIDD